jgi:hypothetical protein
MYNNSTRGTSQKPTGGSPRYRETGRGSERGGHPASRGRDSQKKQYVGEKLPSSLYYNRNTFGYRTTCKVEGVNIM